jgi:hypothetical protein
MYTGRINIIAETRAGNNETNSERRFLEGVEGQGGATGQLCAKPGQTHHAMALQEQRRCSDGTTHHKSRGMKKSGPYSWLRCHWTLDRRPHRCQDPPWARQRSRELGSGLEQCISIHV